MKADEDREQAKPGDQDRELGVSRQRTKIGPARPDMIAGAQTFQRSSCLMILATAKPPSNALAIPKRPLKVPA